MAPDVSIGVHGRVPEHPEQSPPAAVQGCLHPRRKPRKTKPRAWQGRPQGTAKNVAETAKAEAANVASEVKTSAKDLLHQAKVRPDGSGRHPAAEGR